MRKIYLLLILQIGVFTLSTQAQTLYGTTYLGGNNGSGTINKFITTTNNLTVAKSFASFASSPCTNFIQASDGKLYGISRGGGRDYGAIFSFDPSSSDYTRLKDFDYINGGYGGSLIQANDGKLYGTTSGGGSNGAGVIFSYDPSSSTCTKLKDFDNTNGSSPSGSLVQASSGKLYGITFNGGKSGYGVIFSYDPSTSTYTKLHDFDGTNGAHPVGSLIQAGDGKLYGTTYVGGNSYGGVIFSFDPSSSTYAKVKDFDNSNGANPFGSLIQASDGKFYGLTSGGGSSGIGVIFSYDPSSSTYTKLEDFNNTNGANPNGSLVGDNNGKLYGITNNGGSSGAGVIFSFDLSSSGYTKLKDFEYSNGANPNGSLVRDNNGKLYGTTTGGGGSGVGIIFSFEPSTSTYEKLKDFDYFNGDGANPSYGFMQASDGKLYGMTTQGGSSGFGSIFSFDPSSSTYTKLNNFDSTNGVYPAGSLLQASDGKLYGTTSGGGSGGYGVIFSFEPSSSMYTKLKDFDGVNGGNPSGSLMQANDGKLYGMTVSGGSNGFGVIFSFEPFSSTYTVLKDFDYFSDDGANPIGSLLQASDGKLYGVTNQGGSRGYGVIFSFDPSSSITTTLKNFDVVNGNGGNPSGSLIQASDGKLYGMTYGGGSSSVGVIFSYDPSSSTYKSLEDFDSTNGANPNGSLMQASDGKLYGMTYGGGSGGLGVIFSFDPSTSTYIKLKDFDYANGANPQGSAFIEVKDEENKPPVVTLAIPYNIIKYTAPAGIKLNAAATDEDGTITKVEFYNGATLLHTEQVSPYGFLWTDIPSGNYNLTAKATDNSGNVTISNSITVSVVTNKAPLVSITLPVNNVSYGSPASIYISAVAGDEDGYITKVAFYNGGTLLETEYVAPYGYLWKDIPAGNYTLTAIATDNSGLSTTSAAVQVSVTGTTPTVSITSPANNTVFTSPASIKINATASDPGGISKVEFYNGSTLLHTEYKTAYIYNWNNVPTGNYTLSAKSINKNGVVTTSNSVQVSVVDNTAPTISIITPSDNQTFQAPAIIGLSADAKDADGAISKVEFYTDGNLAATEYSYPYRYLWKDVPAGTYTLTAKATDNSGAVTTSEDVTISVTGAGPAIAGSKATSINTPTVSKSVTNKTGLSNVPLGLKLSPNPVYNTLHLTINGRQNKKAKLFILSASGVIIKNIHSLTSTRVSLDVSSLVNGVYFIKVISGDKVMYKQFVKL